MIQTERFADPESEVARLREENAALKAELLAKSKRYRELYRKLIEKDAGRTVLTRERFDQCADDAAGMLIQHDLAKLIRKTVIENAELLSEGTAFDVWIDLPRTIKVAVEVDGFAEVTAGRCDSPNGDGVIYEVTG